MIQSPGKHLIVLSILTEGRYEFIAYKSHNSMLSRQALLMQRIG